MKDVSLWTPRLRKGERKPVYLAIADCIADDVALGRLTQGQRLPPQRELAARLHLDFTTVSRAYAEAQRRGLIESTVGRGSFVSGHRRPSVPRAVLTGAVVDMTMNMPPEPDSPRVRESMLEGWNAVSADLSEMTRYADFGGSARDCEAAQLWLRRRGLSVDASRIVVVPGAQCGILAALSMIAPVGSTVCCEELTYPGLRALAKQLGIRLVGLPTDGEGIDAVAFAGACAQYAPKALYCVPTLNNPTTLTTSAERRHALAEVARHYDVAILEDDAYGFLERDAPPTIASLAPELTFYIAGFSKSFSAGLRIAYMVAPNEALRARLVSALRATTVMASPITAALATRWVTDGTADIALGAIRAETAIRTRLAARILPPDLALIHHEAFHIWLKLPEGWHAAEFALEMSACGVGVVPSSAFAVSAHAIDAVRICLGGPTSRENLGNALKSVALTLKQPRTVMPAVI
ncbi:MAG: PLP-dependent aminotransferase family protein [Janthinobacterium lividum]